MSTLKPRRADRYRRRVPVHFGEALPFRTSGFTTNVSARGLSIASPNVPVSGSRILLEVKLSTGPCRLEGRVVWVHRGSATLNIPNNFGVQLLGSDEAWFRFIAESASGDLRAPSASPIPVVPPPAPAPARPAAGPSNEMEQGRGQPRLRRYPASLPVRFGANGKLEHRGTTLDLSATGVAVASPLVQPLHTQLQLEVELSDAARAHCEGVVVRAKRMSIAERTPNSFAIRITRADESWYRHIQTLSRTAARP
jgi:hypothetical protein